MAFRMGLESPILNTIPPDDLFEVLGTLPAQPLVSSEEWESIKNYYAVNAPDTLIVAPPSVADTVRQFTAEPYTLLSFPLTTLITADTIDHKIYIGSRSSKLFRFDNNLVVEDSFELTSPPSHIRLSPNGDPMLSLMGIMDPNDQPRGSMATLSQDEHKTTTIIDSLKRPVFFEIADLDDDGLEDFVVCAFGNYSGNLVAYRNMGNAGYKKYVLQNAPGSRKVIIRDIDNNGKLDILVLMSQGDEKIMAILNQGDFRFRANTLLQFPPVYGSSYFDLADFNDDGKFDILYTNGDNADYSIILKPYHGVRIFLNNGNNEFQESWFYNMHGASQATARDFDDDGDLDIVAISFFPDFARSSREGFLYFENNDGSFFPQTIPLANAGRWLTMETADIDLDGDTDVLLGALDFNDGVPASLVEEWKRGNVTVMVLRNQMERKTLP